jgi:hypothetical protein
MINTPLFFSTFNKKAGESTVSSADDRVWTVDDNIDINNKDRPLI